MVLNKVRKRANEKYTYLERCINVIIHGQLDYLLGKSKEIYKDVIRSVSLARSINARLILKNHIKKKQLEVKK